MIIAIAPAVGVGIALLVGLGLMLVAGGRRTQTAPEPPAPPAPEPPSKDPKDSAPTVDPTPKSPPDSPWDDWHVTLEWVYTFFLEKGAGWLIITPKSADGRWWVFSPPKGTATGKAYLLKIEDWWQKKSPPPPVLLATGGTGGSKAAEDWVYAST